MKLFNSLTIVVAILICGNMTNAQDQRREGERAERADADRDGQLSAKEIDGAIAVLAKLDVNKDGILDAEELNARGGGGGRGGQGGGGQGGGRGGQDRQGQRPPTQ